MSELNTKKGKIKYVSKGNAKGIIFEEEDGIWYNPTEKCKEKVNQELHGKKVMVTFEKGSASLFQDIIVTEDTTNDESILDEPVKEVIDVEKPKKSFSGVNIQKPKKDIKNTNDDAKNDNKFKTIDIKGKEYVMVNERIKYFREKYKDWALVTEILNMDDEYIIIKASVKNPDGVTKATGIAMEKSDSTFINKTSHVENCETSAWGRALANMGIGIDVSMASADEVANAIKNQGD